MTHKNNITLAKILFGMIVTAFLFAGIIIQASKASAAAPSGLPATVATSSPAGITVGTTAITVFATSTCSARIISTVNKPIMITFTDIAGQTPSATFGHVQSASTTVAYDSGIYGCGALKVYGFDSNTVITVSESR